eukprot:552616-Hanusia_phi.AAC.1
MLIRLNNQSMKIMKVTADNPTTYNDFFCMPHSHTHSPPPPPPPPAHPAIAGPLGSCAAGVRQGRRGEERSSRAASGRATGRRR